MKKVSILITIMILVLASCNSKMDAENSEKCMHLNTIATGNQKELKELSNGGFCGDFDYGYGQKELLHKASWELGHITLATSISRSFNVTADNILWEWSFGRSVQWIKEEPPLKKLDDVVFVDAGSMNHSLVIRTDGSLWAWGSNSSGEIGDGTTASRWTPVKIMEGVISAAAGQRSGFAVRNDGTLWAWGNTSRGNLGDGTLTDWKEMRSSSYYIQPTPIKILDNVTSVAAGEWHGMALKTDGSLWVWGENSSGEIGNGTITVINYDITYHWRGEMREDNDAVKPVKIMENIAHIAAGPSTSFAVDVDGNLWGWGLNNFGQLGDGTTVNRLMPVKIMEDVATIAPGFTHLLAIRTDGSLWGWGKNYFGELGVKIGTQTKIPVKIMEDVIFAVAGMSVGPSPDGIDQGAGRSFAIRADGSLWGWGVIHHGENGTSLTPIEITYDMMLP